MRAVAAGSFHISTAQLKAGIVGQAYSATLETVGGLGQINWRVLRGSLPDGLRLSGGTIVGVPLRAGLFAVTIEATDDTGATDANDFALTVMPRPARFTPMVVPDAKAGESYFFDLSAGANRGAIFELYSGELPPGVRLDSAGRLSGDVPEEAPPISYDFIVQVSEENGGVVLAPLTVRVVARPKLPPPAKEVGCSAGGAGPVSLSILFALFAPFARLRRRAGRGAGRAASTMGALAVVAALALPGQALATYDRTEAQGIPFTPLTGTHVAIPTGATIAMVDRFATVELPFNFRYWDVNYTSVNIGQHGYFTLGGGKGGVATPPPPAANL
jgi:hypothetical protein